MFKEVPSSEIHRAVKEVLNSPKFVRARSEELGSGQSKDILRELIKKALKWIYKGLKKLGFDIESLDKLSNGYKAAYIIEIICIIILVATLIYFIIRFLAKRERVRLDYGEVAEEINLGTDYVKMASDEAQNGNYKEGIRYTFWACIVLLNKKKLIVIEKSKTNYQYSLELRKNNFKFINRFISSAVIFNEVWYGKREADEAKYTEILEFYKILCMNEKHDRGEKHEK